VLNAAKILFPLNVICFDRITVFKQLFSPSCCANQFILNHSLGVLMVFNYYHC
jgi:hypothetical protein